MTDPTNTPRVAPAQEQTAHRAPTDPSEISLPSLNTKLINEIVAHIIRHDGPDPQGRAHPTRKRLPLAEVEAALDVVKQQKARSELRPYHMSPVPTGCWGNASLANEVLKKKCDALLRENFNNDLVDLCTQVTKEDLLTPLTETLGEKEVEVSMLGLAKSFASSPYKIVKHYLTLIGKDGELADFKPYHMSRASLGTWAEETTRDEVLKKKCDALLRENFNNDLVDFCTKVTMQDLLTPLTETLGGREVEVSMSKLAKSFADSPYKIVKHYLPLIGKDGELAAFKPYHMSSATRGTWAEETTRDEVLKKKCDALLRENFNNDLVDFCTQVTQKDLFTPLTETLGEKVVEVSMLGLANSFANSPFKIVKHYLTLIGKDGELAAFKPYHMRMASLGTWAEQITRDEVLKKKCDALLRENFNNDLVDLCTQVTKEDLLTPLTETLGEKEVGKPLSVMTFPLFRPADLWRMCPNTILPLQRIQKILGACRQVSTCAHSKSLNMLRIGPLFQPLRDVRLSCKANAIRALGVDVRVYAITAVRRRA